MKKVVVPYLTPENYNKKPEHKTNCPVVVPYLTPENYNLHTLTPCFYGGFLCFLCEKHRDLEEQNLL